MQFYKWFLDLKSAMKSEILEKSSSQVAEKMDKEENLNNGEDVPDIENNERLLVKRLNATSQIAIVGSILCLIKSLDYEFLEAFLVYAGLNMMVLGAAGSGIDSLFG
ncbi:hypothetical protein P8452_44926 [Trifolium repens]|nr:hypothetical protein P8452_44926 [Trifolium repens]